MFNTNIYHNIQNYQVVFFFQTVLQVGKFFSIKPLPQWLIAPPSGMFPIPKKDNCHVNVFFGILPCCTRSKPFLVLIKEGTKNVIEKSEMTPFGIYHVSSFKNSVIENLHFSFEQCS